MGGNKSRTGRDGKRGGGLLVYRESLSLADDRQFSTFRKMAVLQRFRLGYQSLVSSEKGWALEKANPEAKLLHVFTREACD